MAVADVVLVVEMFPDAVDTDDPVRYVRVSVVETLDWEIVILPLTAVDVFVVVTTS